MKIEMISDIHGDVRSLLQALEEMQPVDQVLCAGDLVLQYRSSNEVFDIVRERRVLSIMGTHLGTGCHGIIAIQILYAPWCVKGMIAGSVDSQ